MEAFVYRWREISTNRWYIGYHKGNPNDGYICSSVIAKPMIQSNPSNWQRKILRFGTKREMQKLEQSLLVKLNAKDNANSYNRCNGFPGLPTAEIPPLNIRVIGSVNATQIIHPQFEAKIKECTGKSYYTLVLENFFRVVKAKDKDVTRDYFPIIEKLFGIKLEMK